MRLGVSARGLARMAVILGPDLTRLDRLKPDTDLVQQLAGGHLG